MPKRLVVFTIETTDKEESHFEQPIAGHLIEVIADEVRMMGINEERFELIAHEAV